MSPQDRARVAWLVIVLIVVGVVGILLMLALLAAWRNHARRDRLLDEGRRLRAAQHPRRSPAPSDAWHESGRRYRDPLEHPPSDAGHDGSHGTGPDGGEDSPEGTDDDRR